MIDLDFLFQNKTLLSVLEKDTFFAKNLFQALSCKLNNASGVQMPYQYCRTGGQILSVKKNPDAAGGYYMSYSTSGIGWNWDFIEGPTGYDYYYNSRIFDYDCRLMGYVSNLYISLSMEGMEEDYEEILSKPAEEWIAYVENYGGIYTDEELHDELGNVYGSGRMEPSEIARLLILCSAYVHAYVHCSTICAAWEEELDMLFYKLMYDTAEEEEQINGCGYLEYFLDYFSGFLSDNKESYAILIPLFLAVYFSMEQSSGGGGVTVYFYTSETMAEYKKLREKYPENPYVERMDVILPFLEDPSCDRIVETEDAYEEYEARVEKYNGYYGDEYVCAYLFFEDNLVMPRMFPMTAAYFDRMLLEFKKEVELSD